MREFSSVKNIFVRYAVLFVVLSFAGRALAFDVTTGMTGTWYDPDHSGEGFILQVLDESEALVFWFTYDRNGKQFWTLGVGDVDGNEIHFEDMLSFRGGKFGPEFNKEDVVSSRWGTLTLTFENCSEGTATYRNSGAFGNGSQDIQKLTSVWGFDCQGRQAAVPRSGAGLLKPGFTGAWYDLDHSGEGFTVEVIDPTTALIYWFTYDAEGNPAWMVAIADIDGASLFTDNFLQPVGGRFGPNFNPADVVRQRWGWAVFSFGSCGNGGMRYKGPDSYGPESTQVLSRLTVVEGTDCGFLGPQPRVQGRLAVAENTFIDGDTNDPETPLVGNNGNGDWQDIFTPAQIAGFVTSEPTGEEGSRFEDTADQGDLYRVVLRKDEVIALDIALPDPQEGGGDLDLFLYDVQNSEEPIATSLSVSPLEKIVAPFDGEFFLWVWAYEGGSNYTLRTGWDAPDSASMLTVNAPMARDEVLVQFKPGILVDKAKNPLGYETTMAEFNQANLEAEGQVVDHLGLFRVTAPYVDMLSEYEFPLSGRGFGIGDHRRWVQVVASKRLLARDDVEQAAPNYLLSSNAVPNDFLYQNQWHYRSIDLEAAWDITTGSSDVVVAVIDSGIAPHPDLVANVDYGIGFDFVRNSVFFPSYDGDGIDSDARDMGVGYTATGYRSHGTHVAGTVGAVSNDGSGAAGVAWNVTLMPVRVGAGDQGMACNAIVDGLRWAGGLSNSSGTVPARTADVVNLSLGGYSGPCPGSEQAINQLRQRGIIVIAAAGNDTTSNRAFPASSPGVVSVSATNYYDSLAYYSNFGGSIDISAPGGDIRQSEFGGVWSPTGVTLPFSSNYFADIVAMQGTSMASPHVAGVAALMKSVNPNLTAQDFDYGLSIGALTDDLASNGEASRDSSFGYGRINARKAVNWAYSEAGNGDRETFITSSVSSLDFGSNTTSYIVDVQKSGPADVFFETWYREFDFVSLEPVSTNNRNFGTYRISINRSGLLQGQYRTAVWFEANNESFVRVNIDFRVGEPVAGEAGALYSVLLDAYTLTPMYWWGGNQSSNAYTVRFDNVVSGAYYQLTGSDMDGDFTFCDEGEFCQLYPTWSEPKLISVTNQNIGLQSSTMAAPLTNTASSSFSAVLGGDTGQSDAAEGELIGKILSSRVSVKKPVDKWD